MTSNQFITNEKVLLSEIVENIIPSTKNLYFLVGFFYFSGFERLYKSLQDKHLRILIGMAVEKDIFNKVKQYEILAENSSSRGEIKEDFYKSFVEIYNETDFFDSEEKTEAFRVFLEKIQDGSLEIKKTLHPNHAKLYLFENSDEHSQGGNFPGTLITGSSNLSISGLESQNEVNIVSRDEHFYNEGKELFDRLWESAVDVICKNTKDEFWVKVIKNIWYEKLPKPYLIYLRVLEEYFSTKTDDQLRLPSEITDGQYIDLKYQIEAMERAIQVIKKHNGVLIADVVGLGKSIIASVVAHTLNYKTVIIAPPHLLHQWDDYQFDFNFNAKVYSSGKIEQALEENDDEEEKLIIIDEAHKYRNEQTIDYGYLHRLCQGNKVALLTATPFNNKPQDIFAMIKLFQIPSRSTIQTVDNLSHQFRYLIREYKNIQKEQKDKSSPEHELKKRIEAVAKRIRDILDPLVIRRSRIDLEEIDEYWDDLQKQDITFPEVLPPELLSYDLEELTRTYQETLSKIAPPDEGGFIGARYKPATYLKNPDEHAKQIKEEFGDTNLFRQSQINLAKFMKRLLVSRFESSVFAFRSTLNSMIKSSETVLRWYTKFEKVPIYKKGTIPDIDSLNVATGEDIDPELRDIYLEEELEEDRAKGLYLFPAQDLGEQFITDLKADIELLTNIRDEWFKDNPNSEDPIFRDPKLDSIREELQLKLTSEPARKIVIFSEYADTVNHLYENLKDDLRIFRYTSKHSTKTNKRIIRQNFDAGAKKQKNKYDVLVATDAISEGVNLNRAGLVINYDIPYNPTRVIQRVGRINRVNKKVFEELNIYNFFPTATGESEIRKKEITTLKMQMIQAILGEDTRVLTPDGDVQSYFQEQYRKEWQAQEEKSWDTDYRKELNRVKRKHPDLIKQARQIPKRTRIRRTEKKNESGVMLYGKKAGESAFKIGKGSEPDDVSAVGVESAFALFKAQPGEEAQEVSDTFEAIYQNTKRHLFTRRERVRKNQGIVQALEMIKALKQVKPEHIDYLKDLETVISELDALPDRFAKQVRGIDSENLDRAIVELKEEVPHSYLTKTIKRARNIAEGKESIILAEELM